MLARAAAALRRPLLLASRAPSRAPARALGIMDMLRGTAEKSQEKAASSQKTAMFAEQLAFLSSAPAYGLAQHTALLAALAEKAGVNGWRTMLLSDAQKADLSEQLVDLKIGSAFTPAEQADARAITPAAKARVAAEVGAPLARVNRFLDGFSQSAVVHKWLQGRKAKGARGEGGRAGARARRAPHTFPHPQASRSRARTRSTRRR